MVSHLRIPYLEAYSGFDMRERVLRRRLLLQIEATGRSLVITGSASDELVVDSVTCGSGARRDGEFAVDRAEMSIDGTWADH